MQHLTGTFYHAGMPWGEFTAPLVTGLGPSIEADEEADDTFLITCLCNPIWGFPYPTTLTGQVFRVRRAGQTIFEDLNATYVIDREPRSDLGTWTGGAPWYGADVTITGTTAVGSYTCTLTNLRWEDSNHERLVSDYDLTASQGLIVAGAGGDDMTSANFDCILLGAPLTTHTDFYLAGHCDVANDGETWDLLLRVKAPPVDPWPNTSYGGHEVHGGVAGCVAELTLMKPGMNVIYHWPNMQVNVWRKQDGVIWRIYGETDISAGNPDNVSFDTGYPTQEEENTYHTQDGSQFKCPLAFTAQSGVIA